MTQKPRRCSRPGGWPIRPSNASARCSPRTSASRAPGFRRCWDGSTRSARGTGYGSRRSLTPGTVTCTPSWSPRLVTKPPGVARTAVGRALRAGPARDLQPRQELIRRHRPGRASNLCSCRGGSAMADADDVRRVALALPDVEEIDSDGFDFRVGGKGFVWSYPERLPGQRRVIRTDIAVLFVGDEAEKQALLLGEPEVFFTAPGYDGWPLVMLRLAQVDIERLTELVTDAWRMRAPRDLAGELDRPG